MKQLVPAGLLSLAALLMGCSGGDQPREGSADIVKTQQATDMSPEQMEKSYRELGIDPNHPPTNRGGNNR
jgi:hypothetical protein